MIIKSKRIVLEDKVYDGYVVVENGKIQEILPSDTNVKAVMINIFGGITRCDDVARGLIIALEQIKTEIPIVVRLSGTNAKEGLEMLKATGLPTVSTMSEAAQKAIELSK